MSRKSFTLSPSLSLVVGAPPAHAPLSQIVRMIVIFIVLDHCPTSSIMVVS
jgi:hypothetical protein